MARQPTSMFGHMMAAGRKATSAVFMNPVSRFIGRTFLQAAERLIPHGASELGQALYMGNAYAPPGVTERLTPPNQMQGNVHGTGAGQPTIQPAQASPTVSPPAQQLVMDHNARLDQAAARMANKGKEEARAR